jgi:hypothetical protein
MRSPGTAPTLILIAAMVGCGSPSPASPTPASAAIAVSASPSPIVGGLCGGCGAGSTEREALTTLAIQETAGVAGAVTLIDMTLREQGTNVVIASGSFDGGGVTQLAGTNRLPARGALNVRCGVHYPPAQAGKAAVLTYVIRVTDDRGNQVSQSIAVSTTT